MRERPKFTRADLNLVRVGAVILFAAAWIGILKGMWWVYFISAGICLLWIVIIKTRYRG